MHDSGYWRDLPLTQSIIFSLPFIFLILSIALVPLFAHKWWERHKNKALLCLVAALPVFFYFIITEPEQLFHQLIDYLAFIVMIGSLFVISGGIFIEGAFAGLPLINTIFLGIGSVLANLVGTTGASMILIRPLMRANKKRIHKTHIVIFFIIIVANAGGCLTPLGDPPLFLGFLKGVPFDWTLRLFPQWALMCFLLLVVFNVIDQFMFNKEDIQTKGSLIEDVYRSRRKFKIDGAHNIFFILTMIAIILVSGYVLYPVLGFTTTKIIQTLAMSIAAILSYLSTNKEIREMNEFTFNPMIEVAIIFAGIFCAMIPALLILAAKAPQFGIDKAWHFFWLTGSLSSFLDNAPAYLAFTSLASGLFGLSKDNLMGLVNQAPLLLAAISCGAVFMGANTYIGNGPNFMVKAIAEEAKIKMPSFFGYMAIALAILLPLYIIVTFVFFC